MKTTIRIFLILYSTFLCQAGISQKYIPGETYKDSTGFVEYRAGNLPIILSAPHGGNWEPDSIPDRSCSGCSYLMDSYTRVITWGLYDEIFEQTGCYPHMIMNRLHRVKFDANRDIDEAADGNALVESAWYGYHAFIDSAKIKITEDYGRGLFLDIHGHAHSIQRTELGYMLRSTQLDDGVSRINSSAYVTASSIRTLVEDNIQELSHNELLTGESSFGTLMSKKGYPAVPSTTDPFPDNGEAYFSGGYNTGRHGSRDDNGSIDGIQIELNRNIRFNVNSRARLIDSLARVIIEYIDLHYNEAFMDNFCNLITNVLQLDQLKHQFSIFPNPASDYIIIKTQQKLLDIEIYNYWGQRVLSKNASGQRIEIPNLPNGYYLVIFKQNNQILGSAKLVKQE